MHDETGPPPGPVIRARTTDAMDPSFAGQSAATPSRGVSSELRRAFAYKSYQRDGIIEGSGIDRPVLPTAAFAVAQLERAVPRSGNKYSVVTEAETH